MGTDVRCCLASGFVLRRHVPLYRLMRLKSLVASECCPCGGLANASRCVCIDNRCDLLLKLRASQPASLSNRVGFGWKSEPCVVLPCSVHRFASPVATRCVLICMQQLLRQLGRWDQLHYAEAVCVRRLSRVACNESRELRIDH